MDNQEALRLRWHLIKLIRRREIPSGWDEEDLIQLGIRAGIEAEARFDKSKGCPIWLWRKIRAEGAIRDELRKERVAPPRPLSLDLMIENEAELPGDPDVHDKVVRIENIRALKKAIKILSETNERLYRMLVLFAKGYKARQVAEYMELSEPRVSQLRKDLKTNMHSIMRDLDCSL